MLERKLLSMYSLIVKRLGMAMKKPPLDHLGCYYKKYVYTLPIDHYGKDREDSSLFIKPFSSQAGGTIKPNEIKSLIAFKESWFIVDAYKIKVPSS